MSEPFFFCQNEICARHMTHPSHHLNVFNDLPICQECFDDDDDKPEGVEWDDLPHFVPAFEKKIQSQQAEIERLNTQKNITVDMGAALQMLQSSPELCNSMNELMFGRDKANLLDADAKTIERLQAQVKELEGVLSELMDTDVIGLDVTKDLAIRITRALSSTEEIGGEVSKTNDHSAEIEEKELIKYIEDECLNLECENEPTGGDDYGVAWKVYSHHQGEPHKRLEGFGRTPIEAIKAALPPAPERE